MINIKHLKTVKLIDIVKHFGSEKESEIFSLMNNHYHGNQQFTNDSYFIYCFPSMNGEQNSKIEEEIYDLCKSAIENETLIIEVSW